MRSGNTAIMHAGVGQRTHALSTAAAAAEFALLLLIALLEIVLLLPGEHKGLSFKQREAWWGSLPVAIRG